MTIRTMLARAKDLVACLETAELEYGDGKAFDYVEQIVDGREWMEDVEIEARVIGREAKKWVATMKRTENGVYAKQRKEAKQSK